MSQTLYPISCLYWSFFLVWSCSVCARDFVSASILVGLARGHRQTQSFSTTQVALCSFVGSPWPHTNWYHWRWSGVTRFWGTNLYSIRVVISHGSTLIFVNVFELPSFSTVFRNTTTALATKYLWILELSSFSKDGFTTSKLFAFSVNGAVSDCLPWFCRFVSSNTDCQGYFSCVLASFASCLCSCS